MTSAPEPPGTAQEQAVVLVVCTGNICRSPAAAALLERSIGADGSVRVVSAGTRAVVGSGAFPAMAELLDSMVVPTHSHQATQLTPQLVRDASAVVVMTRAHRSEVVGMEPSAVRRTFTLRELARLARAVPGGEGTETDASMAERLAALVDRAGPARRPPEKPEDDDVADPYGGKPAAYERAVSEINAAVRVIASVLHGQPGRS